MLVPLWALMAFCLTFLAIFKKFPYPEETTSYYKFSTSDDLLVMSY